MWRGIELVSELSRLLPAGAALGNSITLGVHPAPLALPGANLYRRSI
jgi:hypothetical protein